MTVGRWSALGRGLVAAFLGALGGLALGALLAALLLWVGFAPPQTRLYLVRVGPIIVAWLVFLGALLAAFRRPMLRIFAEVVVPKGAGPEAQLVYLLAGVVAVLAVVQYHVIAFLPRDPTDLPSFLLAARAMAAGQDFYDPEIIATFRDESMGNEAVFPYLYLPLYAVLLRPLALLPVSAGHAVFLIFNALLWPVLIVLCLRLVDTSGPLRGPLAALVLLLVPSFLPTIQTFHHGSPSLLVAVLIVAVFVLEREGRHRAAGVLLAFVVLIKIVPVIIIPYFILRRRTQMLLWAAGAMVALLGLSVAVAGLGPHLHWLTEMVPGLATRGSTGTFFEPGCHPENQSLTGILCKLLGASSPLMQWVPSAAGALVVIVAAIALWRRRNPVIDRLEASLIVVTILLVSTITWFHHMTIMLLPALTLIVVGASAPGIGRRIVLACGIIVLIAVGFEFYLDPWTFVVPNPLTRSIRFQAMLIAYVACVVLVWRTPGKAWGVIEASASSDVEEPPALARSSDSDAHLAESDDAHGTADDGPCAQGPQKESDRDRR